MESEPILYWNIIFKKTILNCKLRGVFWYLVYILDQDLCVLCIAAVSYHNVSKVSLHIYIFLSLSSMYLNVEQSPDLWTKWYDAAYKQDIFIAFWREIYMWTSAVL